LNAVVLEGNCRSNCTEIRILVTEAPDNT